MELCSFLCYDGAHTSQTKEYLMGSQKVSGSAKTDSLKQTALPPMYKILMHNDDYSTMEFVVNILETVFRKSSTEANQIMLNVHLKGVGICGIYR